MERSLIQLPSLIVIIIVGIIPTVISPSFSSSSLSDLEDELDKIYGGQDRNGNGDDNGGDSDDDDNGEEDSDNGNGGDSERAVPSESRNTDNDDEDGDDSDEGIKAFTDNPPNDPLYITSYSFDKETLLDKETLNIIGEIKNNDTETADFVKLTATFYDANNRTLGSDVSFTDPTTLEPGQSGPFKLAAGILGNLNVDEIRYVKFHLNSQ